MKVRDDDRCDRCGHERFYHHDFHGKPIACAAEDVGEQCMEFVEPQRKFTLADVERAFFSAFDLHGDYYDGFEAKDEWPRLRDALKPEGGS